MFLPSSLVIFGLYHKYIVSLSKRTEGLRVISWNSSENKIPTFVNAVPLIKYFLKSNIT